MNTINKYPDEILAVDDAPGSLKLLEEILTGAGYRVRLANDGELALRSAMARPPSLILLDIRMPGIDGYEVCKRLKADERTRSIPVIFLSILEDEREKVTAFQAGGVDFVSKPIHAAEVLARVHTHLALRHAQLDLEARNAEIAAARDLLEERVKERSAELEQQVEVYLHTLEALRESEAKYRQIVDTASEGIWILGPDSKTTFANARMAEMLGYSLDEMMDRPVTDFMCEKDAADHHKKLENRRKGLPENYERCFQRKDGQVLWTNASATPIFDDEHHFKGSMAMFTDITERKRAQEQIRHLADLQNAILNNAPFMVISGDSEGVITSFNPAAECALGYTSEECVGKLTPVLFHDINEVTERARIFSEELGAKIEPGFEVFVAKARRNLPNENEWTYIRKDGLRFPVLLSVTALRDSQGNITGFLGMAIDITERKRWEEELRHSEESYRKLYESMMDGFALSDMDGRILAFNKSYIEMLGYSEEELRNMSIADVTPKEWHKLEQRVIETEVMTRGYSDTYEKEYRRKDGTVFSVELRKYLMRDEKGQPEGMWSVVRDISDRKRAEEEKRLFYRETIRSVTNGKLEICDAEEVLHYKTASECVKTLKSSSGLSETRQVAKDYCESKGLQGDGLSLFITGAGEAMNNALKHAHGGEIFCGATGLEVWVGVCDTGSGIAALTLPRATLLRGFSTKISMGMGYSIMLDVSERVMLSTGPEGTTVILFASLLRAKPVSIQDLPDPWDNIPVEQI